jgi:hypothetical protein
MAYLRQAVGYLKADRREILRAQEGETIRVEAVWFTNTDTGNTTLDLEHVPKGAVAAHEFCLAHDLLMRAKTTVIFSDPIYLMPGDTLVAHAGVADKVTAMIYGQTS